MPIFQQIREYLALSLQAFFGDMRELKRFAPIFLLALVYAAVLFYCRMNARTDWESWLSLAVMAPFVIMRIRTLRYLWYQSRIVMSLLLFLVILVCYFGLSPFFPPFTTNLDVFLMLSLLVGLGAIRFLCKYR